LKGLTQKENGEMWLEEFENNGFKASYKIKEILHTTQSQFQEISILESEMFGKILVLDGIVQTTSLDGHIYNEMISHVPICAHHKPKNVLVIGGGDLGVANELSKYPFIENIDLVEIDALVVESCKTHLKEIAGETTDPRVQALYEDGAAFVKGKKNVYDVVIVDSSDPIGPAEILFHYDFYKDIYESLKEDGLMVCQSQSPIFHMNVLKQSFQNIHQLFSFTRLYTAVVPTYPGGLWSFTLGSKKEFKVKKDILATNTKYINSKILKASFKLPQFLKQEILG
jgi:spermidine synthase